jgi:hypothetical protein
MEDQRRCIKPLRACQEDQRSVYQASASVHRGSSDCASSPCKRTARLWERASRIGAGALSLGECACRITQRAASIHGRAGSLGERAWTIAIVRPRIDERASSIAGRALNIGGRAWSIRECA